MQKLVKGFCFLLFFAFGFWLNSTIQKKKKILSTLTFYKLLFGVHRKKNLAIVFTEKTIKIFAYNKHF